MPADRNWDQEKAQLEELKLERASWDSHYKELQEYYDVGLSAFGVRIFYNQSLLKTLTERLGAAWGRRWGMEMTVVRDDCRRAASLLRRQKSL